MKVVIYCQHIWGVGHLFRSIEICRALSGHRVALVNGGPLFDVSLPEHVQAYRLPGLVTGNNYKGLFPIDKRKTLVQVMQERTTLLYDFIKQKAPDFFLIELYPFGRRAFYFELDPILEGIRSGELPPSRVVCSLRDILIEKKDPVSYEQWVVDKLNRYFDALLVHADPHLVSLDDTFARKDDIFVPIAYTGFITPKPSPDARQKLRRYLGIGDDTVLIVASAGGGKAGFALLQPLIEALKLLNMKGNLYTQVFTGPFMPQEEYEHLASCSHNNLQIHRFTSDFLSYLAAADLSISMGGYNTCMNILATQVPALVWPYPGDREQGIRAVRLAQRGAITVIKETDLQPTRLSGLIKHTLARDSRPKYQIDLSGAAKTAVWLAQWNEMGHRNAPKYIRQ
jgi:predicted glycosyltransferase